MQIRLTIALTLALFSLSGLCHAGKVFKWIDDQGVPQYTDQAPTDRQYSVLETHAAPKSAAAAQEKRAKALEAAGQPEEGSGVNFEAQKKEREQQAKVRAENCKNAQANLKTMKENARVRILGDDGEFRFLSEEEKRAQIQQAQDVIETNCGTDQG